jgi:peptide/nickel transport system permease protein
MLGGVSGGAQLTPAQLAALNSRFGLNKPVFVQYWDWIVAALHGNLGTSYYNSAPVTTIISQRIGPSLELIVGSLVLSIILGGALGIFSAIKRNRASGRLVLSATGLGLSVPDFWLATVAAGFLGLTLHVFPAVGFTPLSGGFAANVRTVTLPILVLSVVTSSFIARHLRSAMVAALESPYIRTAWASGLPSWKVYLNCALRNALGPVITFLPLAFTALVGGTVLIENVFNIPGLGTEIVTAVSYQDYPVVQGVVLLVGVLVAVLNLLADMSLAFLDPRIRRNVA